MNDPTPIEMKSVNSLWLQAAVDSITRNLALEWGTDYGIRTNGIAPGPIADTPGRSKLLPEESGLSDKDVTPFVKIGEKWDIAMAAVYLTSDAGLATPLYFLLSTVVRM
jgi:peroxisomal 2,4-dienoyl-CoA reductase